MASDPIRVEINGRLVSDGNRFPVDAEVDAATLQAAITAAVAAAGIATQATLANILTALGAGLPAALGANGGVQIEGIAGGVAVPVLRNRPVTVMNADGAAGFHISTAHTTPFRLVAVTLHMSAAPTTSEYVIVSINANDGAAYDAVLYRVDPSVGALTDIVYLPEDLLFETGDQVVVDYTNTDGRTYGLRIVTEAV